MQSAVKRSGSKRILIQPTQSSTTTTLTTTTTTTTSSSTTSSAPAPSHTIDAPRCDGATSNDDFLNGGCSDQCTCVPESGLDSTGFGSNPTGNFYCGSQDLDISCTTSDDCPQGTFCNSNSVSCVSGNVPGDECTSTFVFRR